MEPGIKFKKVNEYHSSFPPATRKKLKELNEAIKKAAPGAEETISYNMPTFKLHGPLVYYAGYKNHIGFYPTSLGIAAFTKELSGYKSSKGAVQFPLESSLPIQLITRIVKFRVKQNLEKAEMKKKK